MNLFFKIYPKSLEGKLLLLFLGIHFCVWTLIPLLRQSLPMDSIEAIVWGQICTFGTNKHPPLSGFLAAFLFWLGNGKSISIYILSELCILTGFIYIFRLAKLFLPFAQSCLCIILMEGIIYYGFTSPEYNVNVLSLALWPISAFYFYKATHNKEKYINWILFGLFTGLNLINKYTGGILLIGTSFYFILTKNGRQSFKHGGLYLSAITALIIITPHLIWLYNNNFFTVSYISHRMENNEQPPLINHLWYPIKFILAQFVAGLTTITIYFVTCYKNRTNKSVKNNVLPDNKIFIICLGAIPLLTFASISLIMGIPLKSMWGTPLLYMLTIGLFTFFPFTLKKATFKHLTIVAFIIMILFAITTTVISTLAGGEKQLFNAPKFAQDIHATLGENKVLPYVGGDIWYAGNFSLYAHDHPKVVLDINNSHQPCLNPDDLAKKDTLIISDDKSLYTSLQNKYKTDTLYTYELNLKTIFGENKKKNIYYFLIKPFKDR